MALHPLVLAFMIIWFGGVLLFCVGITGSMLASGNWNPVALVPLGMFIFGWALTSGGFTFEARRASKLLRGIIAARDELGSAHATDSTGLIQ